MKELRTVFREINKKTKETSNQSEENKEIMLEIENAIRIISKEMEEINKMNEENFGEQNRILGKIEEQNQHIENIFDDFGRLQKTMNELK